MKKIPADVIAKGLEEVDEREYMEILSGLIEQKRRSVKHVRNTNGMGN